MYLLFKKIGDILFPRYCMHCKKQLLQHEAYLCNPCWLQIPLTHYGIQIINTNNREKLANPMLEKLKSSNVSQASALMLFEKGGLSQDIVHHIKYKNAKNLGIAMGEYIANTNRDHPIFKDIDYILPIPLHPKRFKQRGYNQSEVIARGIQNILSIPIDTTHLVRRINNPSQTNKTKHQRLENTQTIFEFKEDKKFENKTLLILDDVITTGATLKSAIQSIQIKQKVTIRVYTLAYAL